MWEVVEVVRLEVEVERDVEVVNKVEDEVVKDDEVSRVDVVRVEEVAGVVEMEELVEDVVTEEEVEGVNVEEETEDEAEVVSLDVDSKAVVGMFVWVELSGEVESEEDVQDSVIEMEDDGRIVEVTEENEIDALFEELVIKEDERVEIEEDKAVDAEDEVGINALVEE